MQSTAVLFFLTAGCVCGKAAAERELVYVTVLFRHGDRSPVKIFPTDPHKESDWPQGLGQLSKEGMRQHFELGQFLRKRYNGFLNNTYKREEISVLSTNVDRTMMSAEANLAGLYPPTDNEVFEPNLKWHPIPVHTVPQSEEGLLTFPHKDCPRYELLQKETEQSTEFINVNTTYKEFIELVNNKTGQNDVNVTTAWKVYDTLFCESRHNMSAPHWVTPDVMEKLRELNDFGLQYLFGLHKQQEKSRLQGGVLLGEIVKNLTEIKNRSEMADPHQNSSLKMMMLSAHDTAIAALQASLNVSNGKQPPYASCQIIELYRDNGSFSVSMFYRNDSTVEPYPQQLPGCSLDCPLNTFVDITNPFISQNWTSECKLSSNGRDKEVMTILLLADCVPFLLIFLLLGIISWQTRENSNLKYVLKEYDL